MTGFLSILLAFSTVWAVVRGLPVIALSCATAAAILLALAAYYQIRFGRSISEVPPTALMPPNTFQGWFGLVMFILAVTGMVVVVIWQVLYRYKI